MQLLRVFAHADLRAQELQVRGLVIWQILAKFRPIPSMEFPPIPIEFGCSARKHVHGMLQIGQATCQRMWQTL